VSERELFEIIYTVFKYLTDVPFNFWAFFLIVTAPVLVFSVAPEKPFWMRFGRLVIAAGLTYVLINLAIGTEHSLAWKNYNDCYAKSEFPYLSHERNSECKPYLENVNGSTAVFALLLGWIPALGIVGLWELLWRIVHRKVFKGLSKNYKGRWFSNLTIGFIVASFFFYPFIALIDWLM